MNATNQDRKLIVYIAMSLDGYIAKEDGNIDFLAIVEKEGEDYGYHEFVKTVDTVIMGRKTYDKIISIVQMYPHEDKDSYIITRTARPDEGNVKFYTGDIKSLILSLKSTKGKHIYCDGGAEIIFELLKNNLVDELYISIIPILLGNGIRLFKEFIPEIKLRLNNSRAYESGLVQMHYTCLDKKNTFEKNA